MTSYDNLETDCIGLCLINNVYEYTMYTHAEAYCMKRRVSVIESRSRLDRTQIKILAVPICGGQNQNGDSISIGICITLRFD